MITRGIGAVARGMQAMIDLEDVTAHNVANVTTNGYKKTGITFRDIMSSEVNAKDAAGKIKNVGKLSNGVKYDRTYIDFTQGGLAETGNKLDVAFQGDGFFKIRLKEVDDNAPYDEKNYYYQRVGDFQLTTDNYLVNSQGDYAMDIENKRIRITRDRNTNDLNEMNRMDMTEDLVISENGQIQLNDSNFQVMLQKLQVCDFYDKTKVSTIGLGKYLPIYGQDAGLHTLNDGEFALQQGMVEMSNANTISEMLNTINVSRGYEAMSTLLKRQSETIGQAINLGSISR